MIRRQGKSTVSGSSRSVNFHLLPYALVSVILVGMTYYGFLWPTAAGVDITGNPIGRDFINVWVGPQLAFTGRLGTLFDLKAYHQAVGELFGQAVPFYNWGYPLFVLPVFWPLAQLPYFWALAVWTVGLFAAFAAVVVRELDAQRGIAVVALLLAPASLINIVGGQNGFLSAALFLGGILAIDRRPILAGVLFGLLTFKPHLGLIIPFALVALGAWRVIAVAATTAATLILSSVILFGIEPWQQYLEVAGGYQVLLLQQFRGFYVIMMVSVLAVGRLIGMPFAAALAVQIAVALAVVAVTCWAIRRTEDPCRRAFVLAAAAPLVTPYAFNYDLTALAAILVWCMFGRLPWRRRWGALYLLAWVEPTAIMHVARLFSFGWFPLVQIAVFVFAVRETTDTAVRSPAELGEAPHRDAACVS